MRTSAYTDAVMPQSISHDWGRLLVSVLGQRKAFSAEVLEEAVAVREERQRVGPDLTEVGWV